MAIRDPEGEYVGRRSEDYEDLVSNIFDGWNVCRNVSETDTPYNGRYSRTNVYVNDRPTYQSSKNWIASYAGANEGWVFSAPYDPTKGIMSETEPSDRIYPEDRRDYEVEIRDGDTSTYYTVENVWICCVDTAAPSRCPTVAPTKFPTTDQPTVMPTLSPSSDQPSSSPSVDPTTGPTTDQPTVAPTTYPTSDEPTVAPTTYPTSD